jgi:hypothetical protein
MPAGYWKALERLSATFPASTLARSQGEAIVHLIRLLGQGQSADWLDWEQSKQARLLREVSVSS